MGGRQRSRAEFEAYFYERLACKNGCYVWTGARTVNGYGRVTFQRQVLLTHRVALALVHRDIRDGDLVLHSCDNKLCCRVAHLRVGTHAENMRDASERSVWRRFSEVTTEHVALVMQNPQGLTIAQLAEQCDLSHSTVRRIRKGDIYNYESRYIGGTHVCRKPRRPYPELTQSGRARDTRASDSGDGGTEDVSAP